MRPFSIIIDEHGERRVVPTKWLTIDFQQLRWPASKDSDQIRRSIINEEDPDIHWNTYPVSKYIKASDDYNKAVKEMNLHHLELLSDPSDQEKLKKSRSFRNKRKCDPNFVTVNKKNKNDKPRVDSSDEENSEYEVEASNTLSVLPQLPKAPSSLSVISDSQKHTTTNYENEDEEVDVTSGTPVTKKQSASYSKNAKEQDIIDNIEANTETNSDDLQLRMFGMLKEILTQLNVISLKLNNMDKRISALEQKKMNSNQSLSSDVVQIISGYFPINNDENQPDKKVDVVEMKLRTDRSFYNNLHNRLIQCDNIPNFMETSLILGRCPRLQEDHNITMTNNQIRFMKNKGGSSSHDLIYNILASIFTNHVAVDYSFFGQKKKKKFSELLLCSCIYQATKQSFTCATDDGLKKSIKMWLDGSATRLQRSLTETQRRKAFQPVDLPTLYNCDNEGNNSNV